MPDSFRVWNAHPASATPTTSPSTAGQLGKQDFLNLLAAQLRQQNPMQPLDNKDFMAQTAQFYALEQLQQMNELLGAVLGIGTLNQASTYLGKYITAVADDNSVIEGIVTEVAFQDGRPLLLVGDTVVDVESVVIVGNAAPA